jgi:predicted AAA+ superfamily ATPase
MKNVISQLIDDFHERNLPELVTRNKEFSEVRGKADVVIGMRRAGKTWFCYQKIKNLIASGIKKEEILYLNFEDDRLLEFTVNHFQEILDVYFGKYPEHRNGRCYFPGWPLENPPSVAGSKSPTPVSAERSFI